MRSNANERRRAGESAKRGTASRPDTASRAAQNVPRRRRPEDEPLGRPRTSRLPKPRADRASHFMPFAALTGFEDYLHATDEQRAQMYADDEFAHPEDFSTWD